MIVAVLPKYRVPAALLARTFEELRRCGRGRTECQVLWTSPWANVEDIASVVHPRHKAHGDGFVLDGGWLNSFWQELIRAASGVRVQIHTHPGRAFHSPTDDAWPIIHTPGFLSLVIPHFAMSTDALEGAYLAELLEDGTWRPIRAHDRIVIV